MNKRTTIVTKIGNNSQYPSLDLMKYIDNFGKTKDIESKLIFGDPKLCPDPHISIVIPTYKRPGLLKLALESALYQNNPECRYEVVVVDNDFSGQVSSETKELIEGYANSKLLYYQNVENLGLVGNWNRCIQLARGKWVAFLHDDDLFVSDYICRIVRLLAKKRNVAGIMAKVDLINDEHIFENPNNRHFHSIRASVYSRLDSNKLMRLYQLDSNVMLFDIYGPPTCGSIFRKDCLIELGGFNDSFYPSFDWFFLYRYCKEFKLYRSMETLGYYRISVNTSLSNSTKAGFIRDRVMFTKAISRKTGVGRILKYLFENEQNNSILNNKYTDYPGKVATDYFDYHEIIERKIRRFLYHKIINAYWRIKKGFYLFFG